MTSDSDCILDQGSYLIETGYVRRLTELKPTLSKLNGHNCRTKERFGEDISHTLETEDGRLFLSASEDEKYSYYQINFCPFCGFKAKQQIV